VTEGRENKGEREREGEREKQTDRDRERFFKENYYIRAIQCIWIV
jgi:hypothetical protein